MVSLPYISRSLKETQYMDLFISMLECLGCVSSIYKQLLGEYHRVINSTSSCDQCDHVSGLYHISKNGNFALSCGQLRL